MGTYAKVSMWIKVALTPVLLGVLIWGIAAGNQLLALAGALLLGSAGLSLLGLRLHRQQEQRDAGRRF